MAEYVVFKIHVYEPANEVYFAYSLAEALDRKQQQEQETDSEWEIAEVLPTDNWLIKLILWAHKRSK